MLGERDRDGRGGVGLPAHPHRERLQSLEQHPGIERRERRAGLPDQVVDIVLDEFFRREDDAAETAALAVDVLGGGIDDAVGPELERLLEQRRREHVVDHQRRARGVGDVGDRLDVEHLQRRIGRALEKEGLGVGLHRLAPGLEVPAVDQGRGDAVAGEVLLDDVEAGAEQRLGGDDMVARPHLAHQRGGDGGHPGRGRARGRRPFERAHALLEHVHGGIGEAGILVARLLVLEASLRAQRAVVDVALGEEQRLRRLAELRAQDAGMHELGLGAVVSLRGRGHQGLLCPTKNPAGKASAGGPTRPRPFSKLFYVAASRPAQMTTG